MRGSLQRIRTLILHELFLTRHSVEMFFDIFFFPLMNVLLFGLITVFISDIREAASSQYLILGILLWEVVTIAQYNVTVSSLWSVWSHNLTNIFIAPISTKEYLLAHVLAAFLRSVGVVFLLAVGAVVFFDFNILNLGLLNLALFILNLIWFASWLGIILLGFIFRFGVRIQAISWGVIFVFQPLTAAFFPVEVLPIGLQYAAYALPPTYVFEAARKGLAHSGVDWQYMLLATGLNIGYSLIAGFIFSRLFRASKNSGQFARNDL